MIRKLGKLSSAVFLGCLLSLALCSTGAFAQSVHSETLGRATLAATASAWRAGAGSRGIVRRNAWGNSWYRDGYALHHGASYGRTVRYVRVVRTIRVTQIVHVTRVKIIRVTKTMRVSQLVRRVQIRRVPSCGGDC